MKLITFRPPRIALTLLVATTVLHHLSPPNTFLHLPYKLLATICVVVGFMVMMVAWSKFKKSDTAVCPTAQTSRIVTDTIYRYTRNPMYLGMLLMLFGAAFFMGTIPAMLAPVGFFLIIDKVFIPYEEEDLISSFGDEYGKYMAGTRRWL